MADYNLDELMQWHYGETKEEANQIVSEIMDGKRTAIISYFEPYFETVSDIIEDEVLFEYDNDQLQSLLEERRDMYPQCGDINVLTNWDGEPQCVIRTKGFGLMHFGDIPIEVAELEHGDTNLEVWQERKSEELLEQFSEKEIHSRTILSIEIIEVLEKLSFH